MCNRFCTICRFKLLECARGIFPMADFYQENSLPYHQQTFHIDPTSFLEPLCRWLSPGAKILDVGCGSGRDLLWLKRRGYEVMGFERSFGLAALAAEQVSCPVIVGDFESFDFSRCFMDAVLLVGALVHVLPSKFRAVLQRILAAVRSGGHVLLTLKEGAGVRVSGDGRVFHLWSHEEVSAHLAASRLHILEFLRQDSALKSGEVWLTYVLIKSD